jgi:hypothetical protein
MITHLLVEPADDLFLRTEVVAIQLHRGLKSWRCSNHTSSSLQWFWPAVLSILFHERFLAGLPK